MRRKRKSASKPRKDRRHRLRRLQKAMTASNGRSKAGVKTGEGRSRDPAENGVWAPYALGCLLSVPLSTKARRGSRRSRNFQRERSWRVRRTTADPRAVQTEESFVCTLRESQIVAINERTNQLSRTSALSTMKSARDASQTSQKSVSRI